MGVKVISIHFPKAAGSSLRDALVAAYGEAAVYFDYADDPADPCSPYSLDPVGCRRKTREARFAPVVRVIHGHFHPSKYQHLEGVRRITFLRHPVDNLISIYFFWKSYKGKGHCLFDYFRDNDMTLLDMACLPTHRYLLSRTFFGGVDMDTFDFIGTTENYEHHCRSLSRLLSIPFTEYRENVNTYPGYRDRANEIRSDRETMKALAGFLNDDIEFYNSVLARRSSSKSM